MCRRSLSVSVSLLVLAILTARIAGAATVRLDAEKIKAGLRTAAPEENGFVEMVVDKVDQGKLSANLVYKTFQWARRKSRRRFQYFKYALTILAARAGTPL